MSLLQGQNLSVVFKLPGGFMQAPKTLQAVNNISFELRAGETLGVVGESGSGKSTLARCLVGMQKIEQGRVIFDGQDVSRLDTNGWRRLRRDIQMVFQDPLASLNPRFTVGENIAEPLINLHPELNKAQRWDKVTEMMPRVGLDPAMMNRYPHEFSGGQCQRVGIARALVVRPRVLICDEVVSALDVTVQAQIIQLLKDIRQELNLAMIFIAHDLAVVKDISHRVLVMEKGELREQAETQALFANPQHPYTQALLKAVPIPDPKAEQQRRAERLKAAAIPAS
ncbi:MAG: ATP-binding cassette domain-containing protein [Nevskiales bacterium]